MRPVGPVHHDATSTHDAGSSGSGRGSGHKGMIAVVGGRPMMLTGEMAMVGGCWTGDADTKSGSLPLC